MKHSFKPHFYPLAGRSLSVGSILTLSAWLLASKWALAAPVDQSYQYDALSRLTASGSTTYQHDAAGNLLQISGVTPAPEIAVEQPAGTDIADGGSKDFGSSTVGVPVTLTFTVRNTGNADLTGLAITIDGANASDFTVVASPASSINPSGTTTFGIRFSPAGSGARTAALHLANNDANENPFDITLTGSGVASTTPNLQPYTRSGWSAPIVVSPVTGTNTDSTDLRQGSPIYVDWAAINNSSTAITAGFYYDLYVDGVLNMTWGSPSGLEANAPAVIQDYSIGNLAAGTHTIRLKVDSSGAVSESNEADNEYTKTIVVTDDDHGNSTATATGVALGGYGIGGILTGSDEDYFRVTVPGSGVLIAWTEGNIDTYGYLYNAGGTELDKNDDNDKGNNFRVDSEVGPGDHFIRVKGYSSGVTGPYVLKFRYIPVPVPFEVTYFERNGSTVNLGYTNPGLLTTYYVQGSDDLENWTDLASAQGIGGEKYTSLGNQGANPKRFFRISTYPAPPPGFALIPAGTFQMGDQSSPAVGTGIELPVHSVSLSGFHMAKYETTKELWDSVRAWGMANGRGYSDLSAGNASYASKGSNHPVHSINWHDAVKWCNARSEMEGLSPCYTVNGATYKTGSNDAVSCDFSANGYRLPTEAEWERAARGDMIGMNFPLGNDITHGQANYQSVGGFSYDKSNTTGYHPTYASGGLPYTSPVGSFPRTGFGLFDMAGNVFEWCWDWYGPYSAGAQSNPHGPSTGSYRTFRGGGWLGDADNARISMRYDNLGSPNVGSYYIGFRVVRKAP